MGSWNSKVRGVVIVGALMWSAGAEAQASARGEFRASGSVHGGSSSVYLELQPRIDAFNVAGVPRLISDGSDDADLVLPAIPYVTAGVRLLEGDLFLGLGAGFAGASSKTEAQNGEREDSLGSFMLAPVITYDFVGDGPAALYGLGLVKLGSVGFGDSDPGDDLESAFWWGLGFGLGLRGDITEYVSAFSELGWDFATGSWSGEDGDESRFVHGVFGTLGVAVRLGL